MGSERGAHEIGLLRSFICDEILRQDSAGRRVALLGKIEEAPAVVILERAAFPSTHAGIVHQISSLGNMEVLGVNDVYKWFLSGSEEMRQYPSLKINLIHPATPKHIQKYSTQRIHFVNETSALYQQHVKSYIARSRTPERLQWMHNILAGVAEADRVIYRTPATDPFTPFLLLPDLNWDQKTLTNLHLLVLIDSNTIWTLRDLRKSHIPWLREMRKRIIAATRDAVPGVEADELKLYVHYLPTYFQFHVHVVHVALESGVTQATGKAVGLESLIALLQALEGGEEKGLESVSMSYTVGEQDDVWKEVWAGLKEEREAALEV